VAKDGMITMEQVRLTEISKQSKHLTVQCRKRERERELCQLVHHCSAVANDQNKSGLPAARSEISGPNF